MEKAERAADALGSDTIVIAPSCPLLHCPEDLTREKDLDAELLSWMAFARQKLGEVVVICKAINEGRARVAEELAQSKAALASRAASPRTRNPEVRDRLAHFRNAATHRATPYAARREAQRRSLGLPLLPTTTIGSFPQTHEVRAAGRASVRRAHRAEYEASSRRSSGPSIQEDLGLDVLVHGEFERNDMVEYFGEMLAGFAFTRTAGSRATARGA